MTILRQFFTVVVALSSLVAATALEAAPVALANGNCTGILQTHLFDGVYDSNENGQGTGGGWGAKAWINVRDAAFCTQNSDTQNHISAWAMVASSDGNWLAQDGYRKIKTDSTMKDFVEWTKLDGTAHEENVSPTLSNGTNTKYQVYYDNAAGQMVMDIGSGTYTYSTPYDPYGTWPGPWNEQWFGEVSDGGDEMPGTASAKASFTSLAIQPNKGSVTWQSPAQMNQSDTDSCASFETNNSGGFNIWHIC